MTKIYLFYLVLFFPFVCSSQTTNSIIKIDTTEIVQIGGIKQFLSIKGNNIENPVLLILHGGPGKSLIAFSEKFTDKLKNEFVIVNWDQRKTGETQKINNINDSININLLKSDALEVVKYLINKFQHKKIYLVSHSFGSVMGFDIAIKHPELLYAYIPISPVVDANKSSILTIKSLKKWAIKTKNEAAKNELEKIKIPYKDENDFFFAQKWLFIHNEVDGAETENFKNNYYDWMNIWFPIWKKNAESNLFVTAPKIDCSIYFFIGNFDNQTHHLIAKKYFKFLKAKNKKKIKFKNSGHTILNTESEKLQNTIIDIKNAYQNLKL